MLPSAQDSRHLPRHIVPGSTSLTGRLAIRARLASPNCVLLFPTIMPSAKLLWSCQWAQLRDDQINRHALAREDAATRCGREGASAGCAMRPRVEKKGNLSSRHSGIFITVAQWNFHHCNGIFITVAQWNFHHCCPWP